MKSNEKIQVWAFSFWEVFIALIVLAILLACVIFPFLNQNNKAIFYMKQKKYQKADNLWQNQLKKEPFSYIPRMNLALNHLLNNQAEKALHEYKMARDFLKPKRKKISVTQDKVTDYKENLNKSSIKPKSESKFYSFFNSAVAQNTLQKPLNQVLHFYQQALKFRPNSKEVKTNIELLVKDQSPNKNQSKNSDDKKDSNSGNASSEMQNNSKNQEQKSTQKNDQQNNKGQQDENQDNSEKPQDNQKSGQPQDENQDNSEDPQKNDQEENQKNKPQNENQDNSEDPQEKPQEEKENPSSASSNSSPPGLDQADKDFSSFTGNRPQQPQNTLNQKQVDTILKAILEQEKAIRQRRQKDSRSSSTQREKDW